ncbi:DMT family transporter [Thaumasiovibrio sp. DFM-14]|uniref:DMT family transporter n=1 Tax=Thaumasiovibrio sp. DFM-14 TaxID=3384792 RepID=UPI0039A12A7B
MMKASLSIYDKGIKLNRTILIHLFLYMLVCFCWGTTWISIKFATLTIPPLTSAGLRFLIAFPFFYIICRIMKEPIFYPKGKMKFFVSIVLLYFSIPYFLIGYASKDVSSGLISLIFSTMPIFTIIFSSLFNGAKFNNHQFAGISVGFMCLLMIIINQGMEISYSSYLGIFAVFSSAALHGLCYVLTKRHGESISILTFNTLPIGIAGFGMTALGFMLEDSTLSAFSNQSVAGVFYLGIVASVGGFLAYFYLLKKLNPTILSYVFVIFPVVAIYIGAKYANEAVSDSFVYLVLVMLMGVAYTKYHTPKS